MGAFPLKKKRMSPDTRETKRARFRGPSSSAPAPPPALPQAAIQGVLERFQFETLRISNHTASRFAEKAQFFRPLWAGRRCASALLSGRLIRSPPTAQHKNLPEPSRNPRFPHGVLFVAESILPIPPGTRRRFFSGKKFLLFRTVRGKALLHDTDSVTETFTVIIHFHYSSCVIL